MIQFPKIFNAIELAGTILYPLISSVLKQNGFFNLFFFVCTLKNRSLVENCYSNYVVTVHTSPKVVHHLICLVVLIISLWKLVNNVLLVQVEKDKHTQILQS